MILDEYFDLQREYEAKFGPKTVVFMQVGSFYEIYEYDPKVSTDKKLERIGRAQELSALFGCRLTQKDKSKPYTISNPYMIGFPKVAYETYRNIAFDNGYFIVKVDQEKQGKNTKRKVTIVDNPTMCLDYIPQTKISSNIVTIYIEYHNPTKRKKYVDFSNFVITTGIALIDIITGKNYVCEFYSKEEDQYCAIQDLYRFLIANSPQIVIVHVNKLPEEYADQYVKYIGKSLELSRFERATVSVNKLPAEYMKVPYQTEVLNKLFTAPPANRVTSLGPNEATSSKIIKIFNDRIIDDLELESFTYGRIAYITLLNYINTHKVGVIKKLSKPDFQWIDQDKHLIITHNAIIQLDLISNNVSKNCSSETIDSLISVLDKNRTNLGRRLLCLNLKNPMLNVEHIQAHYDMTEEMLTFKLDDGEVMWKYLDKALKELPDIARLQRKLEIKELAPKEFATLYRGYIKIVTIYVSIMKSKILKTHMLSQEHVTEFNQFLVKYASIFEIDTLDTCTIDTYESGKEYLEFVDIPIKTGNYNDIDEKIAKLVDSEKELQKIVDHINQVCENGKDISFKGGKKKRGVNKQEPAGVMITVSNSKAGVIVNSKYDENICGKLEARTVTTSEKSITSKIIDELCDKINTIKNWLRERFANVYDNCLDDMNKYKFHSHVANLVAKLDLIHSYAKVAHMYNYHKPTIVESENSFLDAKEIRHPVIERIIDAQYVTNDVALKNSGMLLYGVNSTGKSSLSKAVVCNIIMAQAGCYVPSYLTYSPYSKIITSLTSDDNMFKHMSSFNVEMTELRTILRQADSKSLIVTDELSSSTEIVSAMCITSSAIIKLIERKSSFIFSSHMHDLTNISYIKNIPKEQLRICHLTVDYDDSLEKLVFDRKLKDGSGPPVYGLIVIKSMDLPNDFLDLANKIMLEITKQSEDVVNTHKSKYNKEVYMTSCSLCSSTEDLHTHHLQEQHLADARNLIGNMHKNVKGNLAVLCNKCHQNLHSNNEKIVNVNLLNGNALVHIKN